MSVSETAFVQLGAETGATPVRVVWVPSAPGFMNILVPIMTWLPDGRLRIDVPVLLPPEYTMQESIGE